MHTLAYHRIDSLAGHGGAELAQTVPYKCKYFEEQYFEEQYFEEQYFEVEQCCNKIFANRKLISVVASYQ